MKTEYIYKITTKIKFEDKNIHFKINDCNVSFFCDNPTKMSIIVPGGLNESTEKAFIVSRYLGYLFSRKAGYFYIEHQSQRKEIAETREEESRPKTTEADICNDFRMVKPISENDIKSLNLSKYWGIKDAIAWMEEGERLDVPILKFTCFYKVIEHFYDAGREETGIRAVKERMQASDLKQLVAKLIEQNPVKYFNKTTDKTIEKIVDTRDACSHMKANEYGYSVLDHESLMEVNNMIPIVREIAEEAIERHL